MWCRECQQSVESLNTEDHSCDGTKELEKLATERSWQRCPVSRVGFETSSALLNPVVVQGCQTLVEKTMGCNTMTVRLIGSVEVVRYTY